MEQNNDYLEHFGILGMHWGVRRYQNEDGSYTEEGKRRRSGGREYHDDYWKAHDKKDPKYMSDQELQKRINRLNNEKQYKNMTKGKGQKTLDEAGRIGKQFVEKAVIGVAVGMAVKYTKEHMPEWIDKGKDFVEGTAWTIGNLMKKA